MGLKLALAIGLAAALSSAAFAQNAPPWPQPDVANLPAGPLKDTVFYGQKLFTETYALVGPEVANTAMHFSGNNLSCQSCHLNEGTQQFGLPLIGVYGLFPMYIARENEVRTLEERINGCFERSMNGKALPLDSKEMKALVAYMQFLSTGIAVGTAPEGRGTPALPLMTRAADPKHGAAVYAQTCAACHQADGQGARNGAKGDAKGYRYPPLWGPDSFNDGAGMHRLMAAANFIHANMPFGTTYKSPILSNEDAWDVAAYINSQPRPKRAHLERDYPDRSRKPVDAPFLPFADNFPLAQHQYGPFQPIIDAQKTR